MTARVWAASAIMTVIAPSMAAFAACADTGTSASSEDDAAVSPSDATEAGDADTSASRGPCDAGDTSCTAESLPCSATDWCPVSAPADTRQALNAVWGASASDVWVAGSGGGTLHWDGSRWSDFPSGTTYTLNAIWGSGHGDVWIVSTGDVILHSTGSSERGWERVPPIVPPNGAGLVRSVWGRPDGAGVLVGGDWSMAGRGSGGSLWSAPGAAGPWSTALGFGRFEVHGIWGSRADDVWIVGEPNPLESEFRSMALHGVGDEDGGVAQWEESDIQSASGLHAVWGASPNDVWAVGRRGTIRHFTGQAWQIVLSPTTQDLNAVWGSSTNDVWIAGDAGVLLHWSGDHWQSTSASFPVGRNPNLYGIWGSGPGDVWAVGERGTILHSSGAR